MYTIQPEENNEGRLGTKPNAHNQEERVNGEEESVLWNKQKRIIYPSWRGLQTHSAKKRVTGQSKRS